MGTSIYQANDLIFFTVFAFLAGGVFFSLFFMVWKRKSNKKLKNQHKEELNILLNEKKEALSNNNIKQISRNNDLILEQHYQQSLDKNKATAKSARIAGGVGFIFLLLLIVVVLENLYADNGIDDTLSIVVTFISGISGAISSFFSIIFLQSLSRTEKQIKEDLKELRNENFIQISYALIEELKSKDERDAQILKLISEIRKKISSKNA